MLSIFYVHFPGFWTGQWLVQAEGFNITLGDEWLFSRRISRRTLESGHSNPRNTTKKPDKYQQVCEDSFHANTLDCIEPKTVYDVKRQTLLGL